MPVSEKPYKQKKFTEINGKRMAYLEEGEGDAIVFQHGNPTSCYLWRNIMPHCEGLGRLVACDLIGMGDSDKLDNSGRDRYSYAEQREYLYALWEKLDLGDKVVFVIHDWGSALGFEWANRNRAGADHQWLIYNLGAQGALARADRLVDSLDLSVSIKALGLGWMRGSWSTARDLPNIAQVRPLMCEEPRLNIECHLFVGWGLARSGDIVGATESARLLRGHEEGGAAYAGRVADVVEGAIAVAEGRVGEARRLLAPVANGNDNPAAMSRNSLGALEWEAGMVISAYL